MDFIDMSVTDSILWPQTINLLSVLLIVSVVKWVLNNIQVLVIVGLCEKGARNWFVFIK